jgi:hypothetical protein
MDNDSDRMFVDVQKAKAELERVLDWVGLVGPVVLTRNGQRIATISNYDESMLDVVRHYAKVSGVITQFLDMLEKRHAARGGDDRAG